MAPAQSSRKLQAADAKRSYVREMFTAIAPRYDLLNHLLSLNADRRWRRTAVDCLNWQASPEGSYLDLCAGTLDLAVELVEREAFCGRAVGADFVVPMLRLGRHKSDRVAPVAADALQLPFPDAVFDGCTVGFGIRNLADLDRGLGEISRVIKPGGRVVILEFCTPRRWPIRQLYLLYFRRFLPTVGRLISKHKNAYTYLPDSVLSFAEPEDLVERIGRNGFDEVGFKMLSFGIATIHWGVRR